MFTDEELSFIIDGLELRKAEVQKIYSIARMGQYHTGNIVHVNKINSDLAVIENLTRRFNAAKPKFRVE